MKKVMTVQNPDTKEASSVLIGETLDTMCMILSKPDMNRRLGWINCIHDEIINSEFTVVNPVVKDISEIEKKHHKIRAEDKKNYSIDAYMFEAMCELKVEIDINFAVAAESDELLSELDIEESFVSFTDLTPNLMNGRMLPTFEHVLLENQVDELIFKFEATDYIGWESVGYCIYNLTTTEAKCYISPIEFFQALEHKRYGYCGHAYALECMTERDVLDDKAVSGIKTAVEKLITEFDDKTAYDKRIDEAFSL